MLFDFDFSYDCDVQLMASTDWGRKPTSSARDIYRDTVRFTYNMEMLCKLGVSPMAVQPFLTVAQTRGIISALDHNELMFTLKCFVKGKYGCPAILQVS